MRGSTAHEHHEASYLSRIYPPPWRLHGLNHHFIELNRSAVVTSQLLGEPGGLCFAVASSYQWLAQTTSLVQTFNLRMEQTACRPAASFNRVVPERPTRPAARPSTATALRVQPSSFWRNVDPWDRTPLRAAPIRRAASAAARRSDAVPRAASPPRSDRSARTPPIRSPGPLGTVGGRAGPGPRPATRAGSCTGRSARPVPAPAGPSRFHPPRPAPAACEPPDPG